MTPFPWATASLLRFGDDEKSSWLDRRIDTLDAHDSVRQREGVTQRAPVSQGLWQIGGGSNGEVGKSARIQRRAVDGADREAQLIRSHELGRAHLKRRE